MNMPQFVTYRNSKCNYYMAHMTGFDNVTGDGTISRVYISTDPQVVIEQWERKHDENHTPAILKRVYSGWVDIESIVEPLCNKCGTVLEQETSGGGYNDMGDPQPQEVDWVCPVCDEDDMGDF